MTKILENDKRKKYRKFEKSENIWKKEFWFLEILKNFKILAKFEKF